MATHEQIEALKIDENVFELAEDTELEYLVHFAAPYTGADKCVIPMGSLYKIRKKLIYRILRIFFFI